MKVRSVIAVLLVGATTYVTQAQSPEIKSNWVYTTPLKWERTGGAPRNYRERYSWGTTAILYPDGRYVEVSANLMRFGSGEVMVPGNDGLLIATGTWSRVSVSTVRISKHEVLRDKIVQAVKCTKAGVCEAQDDREPRPFETEDCTLTGHSTHYLAESIRCTKQTLAPYAPTSEIDGLQDRAAEGFSAEKQLSH